MYHRVSIQGSEGSFHQIAAKNYLGDAVDVIPCSTFQEVIKVAENKKLSTGGIMAIENSIAGSILPNYTLLEKSKLIITGEIYLHINQNLIVNKGVRLQDIKEVYSHPMALLQCNHFLEKYPQWKLMESDDTAGSARHIHLHKNRHTAAIGSHLAAELYDLEILAPAIQDHPNNYTRFLFLQPAAANNAIVNKASVIFRTGQAKGFLSGLLAKMSAHDIHVSKLQSIPIPEGRIQSIYADMEFECLEKFETAMCTIREFTDDLKIFGRYEKGKIY